MSDNSHSRSIVRGFAWVATTKLFVQVFQWASTIFVARLLLPEHYGIVALATAFTGFMEFIVDLGFSAGLVNKSKTTREEEDGIFYLSLITGLILYLILYVSAPAIAGFYSLPELTEVIRVIGITFIFGSLKVVPEALAMQQMNFKYRALVEMTAGFSAALTAVTVALAGYNLWALVFSLVVNRVVSFIGYLPLFTHFPNPRFNIRKIFPVLKFGASNMGSGLVYFLYSRSEVVIAGKFVKDSQLGHFSMASTLAEIPLEKIGMIFNKVAFPSISKIKHDIEQCKSLFLKMHYYLLVLTYPVMVGLMLVAEDLIVILLTEKWMPLVSILQVFCVINIMKASSMLMSPTLLGRSKPNTVLAYNIICLIIMLPAIVVGLNWWGIMGMVYALAIANIPGYIFIFRAVMQDLDISIREFIISISSAIFAVVIMSLCVLLAQYFIQDQPRYLRLIISVIVGGCTYVSVFFLIFPKKVHEIKRGFALLRS